MRQDEAFFEEKAELLAFDRNYHLDPDERAVPTFEDWMNSPSLTRRGLFASRQNSILMRSTDRVFAPEPVCSQAT